MKSLVSLNPTPEMVYPQRKREFGPYSRIWTLRSDGGGARAVSVKMKRLEGPNLQLDPTAAKRPSPTNARAKSHTGFSAGQLRSRKLPGRRHEGTRDPAESLRGMD